MFYKLTLVFWATLYLLLQVPTADAQVRTWTSASGRFTVQATFIAQTPKGVILRRADNSQTITVQEDQLSETDRVYVRYRTTPRSTKPVPEPMPEPVPEPVAKPTPEPTPSPEETTAKKVHELGLWDGFRGIPWGAHIQDYPDMLFIEDNKSGMKFYTRKDDPPNIGRAKLSLIAYGFYKDRFGFVFVQVTGIQNKVALKEAVFARYGEGERSNQFSEEWCWMPGNVHTSLEYQRITDIAQFSMTHMPMYRQQQADRERRAKEAASDF